jgi:SAM-dependent methyltransferase
MSDDRPTPEPGSDLEPHRHRRVAESFGADTERYDRTRPPYTQALVQRILAASPGRDVLDVGAGTGIEARQFQAAGCVVLGVEPDPRMAEFARRTGVEVATFEAWDPAGRDFDAVIAGTAWHWVDPVAGAAKAAHVLRPGGACSPRSTTYSRPPPTSAKPSQRPTDGCTDAPISPTTQFIVSPLEAYQPLFSKIADGIRRTSRFSEPQQWRFDWERTYTRDEWLDQLPTLGGLTRLAQDKLTHVLRAVATAINAIGGTFTRAYTTVAVTASRAQLRAQYQQSNR